MSRTAAPADFAAIHGLDDGLVEDRERVADRTFRGNAREGEGLSETFAPSRSAMR